MDAARVAGLGWLLWTVSSLGASPRHAYVGSLHRAVGAVEIQKNPEAHEAVMGLAARRSSSPAHLVRALGRGVAGWMVGAG